MKSPIVQNPGDFDIIKNPNTNPTNPITMAKSTKSKAIDEFSQQAKTAAYILGGQALAAQFNGIAVPMVLKNQSPTIQQIARAGIPLATGVLLAISVKNKYVRGLSLGFGTQGVLEAIRLVLPNANPQEGFNDGSHFVYQDENGNQKAAVVTPDGQVVTAEGKMMLPQATASNGAKKQSNHVNQNAELSGWQTDSHYAQGMEMEEV